MASGSNGNIPAGLIMDANLLSQSAQAADFLKAAGTSQAADGAAQSSHETSDAQQKLQGFWQAQIDEIQNISTNEFKTQELPLARIKKIMKMDDDVKMISAEAPLLFSKAAQIFITELSLRAWIHTEDSKRRTLQRNDIATAITKFDQFDFLIDIVPREELKPAKRNFGTGGPDGLQFYYTVQQQSGGTATVSNTVASLPQGTIPVSALQSGQLVLAQPNQNGQPVTLTPVNMDNSQVLQLAQPAQQQQQVQQQQQQQQQQQAASVLVNAQPAVTAGQNVQKQDSTGSIDKSTQAILQQIVSGLPNATPGEVHSIQMNAEGQLQLVKIATSQSQAEEGTTQRLVAGGNGQMFELASNMTSQQVERDPGDHSMGTIYMNQNG